MTAVSIETFFFFRGAEADVLVFNIVMSSNPSCTIAFTFRLVLSGKVGIPFIPLATILLQGWI